MLRRARLRLFQKSAPMRAHPHPRPRLNDVGPNATGIPSIITRNQHQVNKAAPTRPAAPLWPMKVFVEMRSAIMEDQGHRSRCTSCES
jgi:hypothetical protein